MNPHVESESAPAQGEPAPEHTLARLEAALAELGRLDARTTGEHVVVFERVHVALTDALSAIDGV